MILRIVSSKSQVEVASFQQLCKSFSLHLIQSFPWARLNHTLHATVHHSPELMQMNDCYSLGSLSEEGLESNNKDIRNFLLTHSRKMSHQLQLTDVMHRLLERSFPEIADIVSLQRFQKRCKECGSTDHTIRSHGRIYSLPMGNYDTAVMDILIN